ncbi:hypothetical protein [Nocardioides humi]|uniref:hypothetical protein n=1 Tax=Nocardioides humi TaxID=449461 RepID=UPI00319DC5B3
MDLQLVELAGLEQSPRSAGPWTITGRPRAPARASRAHVAASVWNVVPAGGGSPSAGRRVSTWMGTPSW